MYSTCLFCHRSLGRNEVLETFPIGRRIAYDAAKGRLWVVCRSCERWNLTPLEERWEAIEQAESLFRGTRLRVSTDEIGLARLREGLELVRIGRPLRPELAAWRYGDQFHRRRNRHLLLVGGLGAAAVGVAVAGPVLGIVSFSTISSASNILNMVNAFRRQKATVAQVRVPDLDTPMLIRRVDLDVSRVLVADDGGFALKLRGVRDTRRFPGLGGNQRKPHEVLLRGEEAIRAASALLPRVNARGASRDVVRQAVSLVESGESPHETFARIAVAAGRRKPTSTKFKWAPGTVLSALPIAERLALEMASHEDAERRALDGELAELERAWRDAEEIAAIADAL